MVFYVRRLPAPQKTKQIASISNVLAHLATIRHVQEGKLFYSV